MKKLKPLYEKIALEEVVEDNVSDGGIVIPETSKQSQFTGKVIAVGEGHLTETGELKPLVVKAGDTVVFHKTSATEVELDGTKYFVMKEQDIVGVVA